MASSTKNITSFGGQVATPPVTTIVYPSGSTQVTPMGYSTTTMGDSGSGGKPLVEQTITQTIRATSTSSTPIVKSSILEEYKTNVRTGRVSSILGEKPSEYTPSRQIINYDVTDKTKYIDVKKAEEITGRGLGERPLGTITGGQTIVARQGLPFVSDVASMELTYTPTRQGVQSYRDIPITPPSSQELQKREEQNLVSQISGQVYQQQVYPTLLEQRKVIIEGSAKVEEYGQAISKPMTIEERQALIDKAQAEGLTITEKEGGIMDIDATRYNKRLADINLQIKGIEANYSTTISGEFTRQAGIGKPFDNEAFKKYFTGKELPLAQEREGNQLLVDVMQNIGGTIALSGVFKLGTSVVPQLLGKAGVQYGLAKGLTTGVELGIGGVMGGMFAGETFMQLQRKEYAKAGIEVGSVVVGGVAGELIFNNLGVRSALFKRKLVAEEVKPSITSLEPMKDIEGRTLFYSGKEIINIERTTAVGEGVASRGFQTDLVKAGELITIVEPPAVVKEVKLGKTIGGESSQVKFILESGEVVSLRNLDKSQTGLIMSIANKLGDVKLIRRYSSGEIRGVPTNVESLSLTIPKNIGSDILLGYNKKLVGIRGEGIKIKKGRGTQAISFIDVASGFEEFKPSRRYLALSNLGKFNKQGITTQLFGEFSYIKSVGTGMDLGKGLTLFQPNPYPKTFRTSRGITSIGNFAEFKKTSEAKFKTAVGQEGKIAEARQRELYRYNNYFLDKRIIRFTSERGVTLRPPLQYDLPRGKGLGLEATDKLRLAEKQPITKRPPLFQDLPKPFKETTKIVLNEIGKEKKLKKKQKSNIEYYQGLTFEKGERPMEATIVTETTQLQQQELGQRNRLQTELTQISTPTTIERLRTTSVERLRTLPLLRQGEKVNFGTNLLTQEKLNLRTEERIIPMTAYQLRSDTQQRTEQLQRTNLMQELRLATPTESIGITPTEITPRPTPTPPPIIPLLPSFAFEKGGGQADLFKKKRKFAYTPSFTAFALGIKKKGKQPKESQVFSGFELRPIYTNGLSNKRKRRVRK